MCTSFFFRHSLPLLPPGLLDLEEFTVAMQLIDDVRATSQVPDSLPAGYVPSGKRAMVA